MLSALRQSSQRLQRSIQSPNDLCLYSSFDLEYCSNKFTNAYAFAFDLIIQGGVFRQPESELKLKTLKWLQMFVFLLIDWHSWIIKTIIYYETWIIKSVDSWKIFVIFHISVYTEIRRFFVMMRAWVFGRFPMFMCKSFLSGKGASSSSCMLRNNIASSWRETV